MFGSCSESGLMCPYVLDLCGLVYNFKFPPGGFVDPNDRIPHPQGSVVH